MWQVAATCLFICVKITINIHANSCSMHSHSASDVISCALMQTLVTVCLVSVWSTAVSALHPSWHMRCKYGISWQSVVVVMANQINDISALTSLRKRPLDRIKTPRIAFSLRYLYKVGQCSFQGFTALFKWRSSGLRQDVGWDYSDMPQERAASIERVTELRPEHAESLRM